MQFQCEFCLSLVEVPKGGDATGAYVSLDWAALRRSCIVLSRRTDDDNPADAVRCEVLVEQIRWSRTAMGRQRAAGPDDLRGGAACHGREE